jgi:hypothetical protein
VLRVPKLRQPDPVSCLPTSVYSVLLYALEEAAPEYEVVARACVLGPKGAVDEVSFYGLREAELDVEVLYDLDPDQIAQAIGNDRPVVLLLGRGVVDGQPFAHAVVACEVTDTHLTVMDPDWGDYVELPIGSTSDWIDVGVVGGFLIAGWPCRQISGLTEPG